VRRTMGSTVAMGRILTASPSSLERRGDLPVVE
jgi:hypothetical protein